MSKKLLLADDSITIQKVVGITFAAGGYDLTVVGNGDSALEIARTERPDLLLADVCMPGKNGYELCAALKEDPSLCEIPVLLLTGTFEPFDESKATRAGADGWVKKPFESQALIKKVEELLSRPSRAAHDAGREVKEISPAGKPVHDIWADLSSLEVSSEAETGLGHRGEGLLPESDDFIVEDLWEPLASEDSEDAAVQALEGYGDAEAAIPLEPRSPAAESSGKAVFVQGAEVSEGAKVQATDNSEPTPSDNDIWAFSEDDEEILFLSETDVIEEPSRTQVFSEETIDFDLDEPTDIAAAEAINDMAEDASDRDWLQTESELSAIEPSSGADPLASEADGDFLGDEFEEFALEGFDLEPEESVDDDLDLSQFEAGADELEEPVEILPLASSPEDPFQIGADDFLAAQVKSAEIHNDSPWPETEEIRGVEPKWKDEFAPVAQSSSVEEKVSALSEEEISRIVEKVAGTVIERLAQTMLERIAWEVVPDLAEVMIKEEIRRIREEVK